MGNKSVCPKCNKTYSPKFPKGINNVIQYGSDVKSLVTFLNTYCSVPNDKISELIKYITNDKIKMVASTVTSTVKQFKKKAQKTYKKLKNIILHQPCIYEDETPIDINGKLGSAIGCFTDKYSYIDVFENRKLESFKKMGIHTYRETMVHDHNKMHENFTKAKHGECNFHATRYCESEYLIHKRETALEFKNYLFELKSRKENYMAQGIMKMEEEEIIQIKKQYFEILDKWDEEYDEATKNLTAKETKKYHSGERCLKARLRKYINEHLRFITDFRVDFTNNLAERGLRPTKTKLKVIGGFRNLAYAKCYFVATSIIQTCKKQKMNIGNTLKSIFDKKRICFT